MKTVQESAKANQEVPEEPEGVMVLLRQRNASWRRVRRSNPHRRLPIGVEPQFRPLFMVPERGAGRGLVP